MRALVVDDSRAIRLILKKMMTDIGFEVFEAGNGREALERLKEIGAADIALIDWNMPEMDGYQFVCAVRADHEYDALKLMMVTTESGLNEMTKALEAGANEYVMKPFTREVIVDKLQLLGLQV